MVGESQRRRAALHPARLDEPRVRSGFIGYYLASLVDFMGLKYISAALERLVLFLYPTIVVLLSACGKASRSRAARCWRF